MNNELSALRLLAEVIADRLRDQMDRRIAAGHGRCDAVPEDLAALIRCQQDLGDALAVVTTLGKRHTAATDDELRRGLWRVQQDLGDALAVVPTLGKRHTS